MRCRFCDQTFEAPDDKTDFCRACYFDNYQQEKHAAVLSFVRARFANAKIVHTGGHCFAIRIHNSDGSYWLITNELAVPDKLQYEQDEGQWEVACYLDEEGAIVNELSAGSFASGAAALAHITRYGNSHTAKG